MLKAKVLNIITNKPGVFISQICRTLNDRGISYCRMKDCYANPRKKAKWGRRKPVCKHHLNGVRVIVHLFEKRGLISTRMERRGDVRGARMWDWMKCCYLTEVFPEVPDQTVLTTIMEDEP